MERQLAFYRERQQLYIPSIADITKDKSGFIQYLRRHAIFEPVSRIGNSIIMQHGLTDILRDIRPDE